MRGKTRGEMAEQLDDRRSECCARQRTQAAENGANRERFQHYIVELAAEHEQEYAIMDHEAQHCRGMLAKQPAAARKAEKK